MENNLSYHYRYIPTVILYYVCMYNGLLGQLIKINKLYIMKTISLQVKFQYSLYFF